MYFLGFLPFCNAVVVNKSMAPFTTKICGRTLSYGTMAGMILIACGSLIMNVFLEDLMKSPREQESMVLALEFGYLPGEVMASHRTDIF